MPLKEDLQAEIKVLEEQGANSLAIHHQCFGAAKALNMVIRKMDEAEAATAEPDIGDVEVLAGPMTPIPEEQSDE